MTDRFLAATLYALLSSILVTAAFSDGGEFSVTTSVVVVEVPVNVVLNGDPLRGLEAENFEIRMGREKVDLVGFEAVDLDIASSGIGLRHDRIPIAARRHFLVFFDLSHSSPSALLRARHAVREVVLNSLYSSDLVAVATYSSRHGARLILSFTSDRRQVGLAIDTLGTPDLLDTYPDPLQLVLGNDSSIGGSSDKGQVDGAGLVEEHLRSLSNLVSRAAREEGKSRIGSMTRSMVNLADLLSSVEGRKSVIFLSQGFSSNRLLGSNQQKEMDRVAAASLSGEIWNIDSDQRFGHTESVNDLEEMIESFRQADCAIHSIDISSLMVDDNLDGGSAGKDGLVAIARGTGGEFFENFNDLELAVGELLERTSVTYVLAFRPTEIAHDGKFHKIQVKLLNGPPKARLEHRSGFYAPRPQGEQSIAERSLSTSEQILSGEVGGSIVASAMAMPFLVPGEKAYVPVFVEVNGQTLVGASSLETLKVELYVYALGSDGNIYDYFARQIGLNPHQVSGTLASNNGIRFYGHLDLVTGDYSLRILVRYADTQAYSLSVVEVNVPELQLDSPLLLPPVFPDRERRWILIPEDKRREEVRTIRYPFAGKDGPFSPFVRAVVTGTEQAMLWLVGYNLGGADLHIEGRIVDESDHQIVWDLSDFERRRGQVGNEEVISAFLPAGLDEGNYLVEISTGPAGGAKRRTVTARFEFHESPEAR